MWMKIDDGLHAHRKTRAVLRSGAGRRDAGPMGLWVLAGAWAGQNGTGGWVPEDELERWDDDWELLADRLVRAGYWWPVVHDGEPGFEFNDWQDYNFTAQSSEAASKSGAFGNHKRWHVQQKRVDPDCEHCPKEPGEVVHEADIAPDPGTDSAPDRGGDRGADRGGESQPDRLPVPDPTRPDPINPSSDQSDHTDRFEEFWDIYGKKVGKVKTQQKWRLALKKRGVDEDILIDAASRYVSFQKREGKHPEFTKDPATWLNGEHWTDERPLTSVQAPRQTHVSELPPPPRSIADDAEACSRWYAEKRAEREAS